MAGKFANRISALGLQSNASTFQTQIGIEIQVNRIIYEVRQDTIYIHVIVDARRDMPSFLMRRLVR